MKTKLFTLLMTLIIIGFVIPAFADSPEKDKGEKLKTESVNSEIKTTICLPNDLLPAPWTAKVIVADSVETCAAMDCNLYILVYQASDHCVAQSAIPIASQQYTGALSYSFQISDEIPCVIFKIVDYPSGSCNAPFNHNTCCACKTSNVCTLMICDE
jgi:hypothetical protein